MTLDITVHADIYKTNIHLYIDMLISTIDVSHMSHLTISLLLSFIKHSVVYVKYWQFIHVWIATVYSDYLLNATTHLTEFIIHRNPHG